MRHWLKPLALLGALPGAWAGEVAIEQVVLEPAGPEWTFHVTLRHGDTGWEHYADAWRVVDAKGRVLGERVLYHPHVDEQPFTRSLSGLAIPSGTGTVYVEAHDKAHGWSPDRVAVDLSRAEGERYRIRR